MSEKSHSRSAKAQKAEEVQAAGSAKAGAGHPVVNEGGLSESPTNGKGHPKPAASSSTLGKAEKEAAAEAGHAKEQHGRGRRKAEEA